MSRRVATVALAATLACGAPAAAQLRGVEFRLDNDQFAFTPGTEERWYTSGAALRGAWDAGADAPDARLLAAWCTRVIGCDDDARRLRVLSLGHAIYTPASTATASPQPLDRPYAAALHVGFAGVAHGSRSRQTLELRLGTVGPAALGEPVQNAIHALLAQARANGWDAQVRAQPLAELGWSRLTRHPLSGGSVDGVLRTSAQLGTPVTQAGLGAMLRYGRLPRGPSWPGETVGAAERDGAHVYAGVEARAVARDRLIDGRTYGHASLVEREPLVGSAFVGASIAGPGDWHVELAIALHSVPFDTPAADARLRPQRIGTIGLRWSPAR